MAIYHNETGRTDAVADVKWGTDLYVAHGYAHRNPHDEPDMARGRKISQGKALKALADIIWRADTAQAIWKAQEAREMATAGAANSAPTPSDPFERLGEQMVRDALSAIAARDAFISWVTRAIRALNERKP
jgi:hypothetical protein